jgi:hypothetical protein
LMAFGSVTIFFEIAGLAPAAGMGDHVLSLPEQSLIDHYQVGQDQCFDDSQAA